MSTASRSSRFVGIFGCRGTRFAKWFVQARPRSATTARFNLVQRSTSGLIKPSPNFGHSSRSDRKQHSRPSLLTVYRRSFFPSDVSSRYVRHCHFQTLRCLTHFVTPNSTLSVPDFPYEKLDRYTLLDDCRASWKYGVIG